MKANAILYKDSGVDIEAGYKSTELIKKHVKQTFNKNVIGDLGSFGGLFNISSFKIRNPVLVSGTDGVGSKILIAMQMDKHDTIGIDLVAMCVNDIIAQGAIPLFFLDYIALHKNYPKKVEQIIKGIVNGCLQANTALIGGETAEMPDVYGKGHYDLAGFTVGIVDQNKIINGSKIKADDVIIGLASSGIHSNGYSLVRKVLLKQKKYNLNKKLPDLNYTIGETLLTPTRIYVKVTLEVLKKVNIKGIAHITGGGFFENIPRTIPNNLGIKILKNSFPILPIFQLIQKDGKISDEEMFNVFNMGIGMVYIVNKKDVDTTMQILKKNQTDAYIIGSVSKQAGFQWI